MHPLEETGEAMCYARPHHRFSTTDNISINEDEPVVFIGGLYRCENATQRFPNHLMTCSRW